MIFEWIMSGKVVNLPVIVINFAAHLKQNAFNVSFFVNCLIIKQRVVSVRH